MQIRDRVVVITGGSRGIGKALCERLHAEGAAALVIADIDDANALHVAESVGGLAVHCDVSREADLQHLVQTTLDRYGQIDLFCSNAGITAKGGINVPNQTWQAIWEVNVMAHVYAARAVLPHMIERGAGHLLQTVSAAGLLTEIGSAPYSVTKHAALSFAEWLSIHHRHQGIGVSCVCPLGVETDMLDHSDPIHDFLRSGAISPQTVADCIVTGLHEERFLILPHPEVDEFHRYKSIEHERWLHNMARIHQKVERIRRAA